MKNNHPAKNHKETEIQFTCTRYDSIQINKVACSRIDKYKQLLANSPTTRGYDIKDDKIKDGINNES